MYLCLQDGKSPLMVASSGGHFRTVKLLLDKGAEVNHQNMVSYVQSISLACTRWLAIYMYVLDVSIGISTYSDSLTLAFDLCTRIKCIFGGKEIKLNLCQHVKALTRN